MKKLKNFVYFYVLFVHFLTQKTFDMKISNKMPQKMITFGNPIIEIA